MDRSSSTIGWRASLVNGDIRRAPLVVAADGAHSRFRHRLHLNVPVPRSRIGARRHYQLPAGRTAEPWVDIFLGRDHEFYVTPLPERQVLVALLAEAGAVSAPLERAFDRWRDAPHGFAICSRGPSRSANCWPRRSPRARARATWPAPCSWAMRRAFSSDHRRGDCAGADDVRTPGHVHHRQSRAQPRRVAARLRARTPRAAARLPAAHARGAGAGAPAAAGARGAGHALAPAVGCSRTSWACPATRSLTPFRSVRTR